MYKFQLVESKDGIENYSNVVYEKELDDELLVSDNIDMIQIGRASCRERV